jgi:hypothetical protein
MARESAKERNRETAGMGGAACVTGSLKREILISRMLKGSLTCESMKSVKHFSVAFPSCFKSIR